MRGTLGNRKAEGMGFGVFFFFCLLSQYQDVAEKRNVGRASVASVFLPRSFQANLFFLQYLLRKVS